MTNFKNLIITNETKLINNAFYRANSEYICFYGTEAEYAEYYASEKCGDFNLTDPSNDTFAEHIKYYSENTPTESGKYWHFLEDGVTPILWMV